MLKTTVLCRSTELSKSETALTLILILEKEAPSGLMWRQIRSDQLPVTMGQGSIWFPISDSNVNTLTMSKTSVLEMGAPGESITVTTDTLQGDCSVLWYKPRAQGTLKINNKSEGTHFALLGSTGRSIQETHYLFSDRDN